jgi:Protein kinase domain
MERDQLASAPGIGPGTVLNGTYRIESRLGSGGMGDVWLATNIEIDEQEAVKVIKPEWANLPKIAALLRKEAKALRQLAVPEIALFRACATDQQLNALYLVTEYVNGNPLTDRINGRLSHPRDVLKLLKRIGTGLRAAHDLNIIHRDISPDNVLLPSDDLERAKIIDFGIAKDMTPGAKTVVGDGFAGRFDYSAPELFSYGRLPVGPWSDIYSLGLVAVALAQGEPVDMGTTMTEAHAARQKPVDLEMVPPILHGLLAQMLHPEHSERMQSMGDLLTQIGPIMAKLDRSKFVEPVIITLATMPDVSVSAEPATLSEVLVSAPVVEPVVETATNLENGAEGAKHFDGPLLPLDSVLPEAAIRQPVQARMPEATTTKSIDFISFFGLAVAGVGAIAGVAMATNTWWSTAKTEQPDSSLPPKNVQPSKPESVLSVAESWKYSGLWRLKQQSSPSDCNPKSDVALLVRLDTDGKGSLNGEALEDAKTLPQGGVEIGHAFLQIEDHKLLVREASGVKEKPLVYVRCYIADNRS